MNLKFFIKLIYLLPIRVELIKEELLKLYKIVFLHFFISLIFLLTIFFLFYLNNGELENLKNLSKKEFSNNKIINL